MTIEKFYETLKLVTDLDLDLNLQTNLQAINTALANLVSSPGAPSHQSALASALALFTAACEKLKTKLSPAQTSLICEVGGKDFFDPQMAEKVQSSVSGNAMTPSVERSLAVCQLVMSRVRINAVLQAAKGKILENLPPRLASSGASASFIDLTG